MQTYFYHMYGKLKIRSLQHALVQCKIRLAKRGRISAATRETEIKILIMCSTRNGTFHAVRTDVRSKISSSGDKDKW